MFGWALANPAFVKFGYLAACVSVACVRYRGVLWGQAHRLRVLARRFIATGSTATDGDRGRDRECEEAAARVQPQQQQVPQATPPAVVAPAPQPDD